MLKRVMHTTERMAKDLDKQDTKRQTHKERQDDVRERGCEKDGRPGYVWQPDTVYITSKTSEQQHSRNSDAEASSQKKIDMDRDINQKDYLDETGSEEEARIRQVTYEYTLPEIMAATKKKRR